MIIWLASYPRSGNTLLRIILKSVFDRRTFSKHDDVNDIGADSRVTEAVGHQFLGSGWDDAYQKMRNSGELFLVKTHDPPQDEGRAIYVVRDGRSTCRSFYQYLKDFPHLAMEFSVRDVVAGFTPFGSWGDHLDSWDPLSRPKTLLVRYEDLVANSTSEIRRIAEFAGLEALNEWNNNFDRLHEMNPKFFRAGNENQAATALEPTDEGIFWAENGDWMRRLGYGEPSEHGLVADVGVAYRRFISAKGKQSYNLRERVHLSETRVRELETLGAQERAEATADAAGRIAELYAELEQARNDAVDLRAALTASEQGLKIRQAELHAELQKERDSAAEQSRLAQEALNDLQSRLAAEQEALREARIAISAARAELLAESAKREAAAVAARVKIDANAARELVALDEVTRVQQELIAERTRVAELLRSLESTGVLAAKAEDEHALELAEKDKAIGVLADATREANRRVKLLLSSRLLRLGWRVGIGSSQWADVEGDHLSKIADQVQKAAATTTNGDRSDMLRKIIQMVKSMPPKRDEMDELLQHLVDKGFRPKVVIDIGAAKGYWTMNAAWRWKDAEFFLIDPLAESEPSLKKLCEEPRFKYILSAVGKEPGQLLMNVTPDCDGSSLMEFPNPDPNRQRPVPIETIDRLIESGKLKPPQFVKLDVQGFEMNVLEGGRRLFDSAEVFIIEANFFEFMPGCPRVHELVQYMADRGFYPFDFAGFLRRPYQNDLGQIDIVFVRKDSPMTASNRWA